MRITVEKKLDIDDVLYQSPAGPIMVLDVLYGYGPEIEQSGQDFYAHKTGFTQKSLLAALHKSGFLKTFCARAGLEVTAVAFKGTPDQSACALFNLPND